MRITIVTLTCKVDKSIRFGQLDKFFRKVNTLYIKAKLLIHGYYAGTIVLVCFALLPNQALCCRLGNKLAHYMLSKRLQCKFQLQECNILTFLARDLPIKGGGGGGCGELHFSSQLTPQSPE